MPKSIDSEDKVMKLSAEQFCNIEEVDRVFLNTFDMLANEVLLALLLYPIMIMICKALLNHLI